MPVEDGVLRRIEWLEAFPILRLFRTVRRAVSFQPMLLSLMAVVLVYVLARVFDAIWLGAGAGAIVDPTLINARQRTEIEVFAAQSTAEFVVWRQAAISGRATQLAKDDDDFRAKIAELRTLIDAGLSARLQEVDEQKPADEKAAEKEKLSRARELVHAQLTGRELSAPTGARRTVMPGSAALLEQVQLLLTPKTQTKPAADPVHDFRQALTQVPSVMSARRAAPQGPFAAFLDYQMDCFAGAVRGATAGRLFFAGGVYDAEPSMLGCVASAGGGGLWLATRRPWYFLIVGGLALAVFSMLGTAVCRSAAIHWSREEGVSTGKLLAFSSEKFLDLLVAPGLPIAIFVVAWAALFVGGVVGAIPVIGTLLSGLLFGVALLLGVALVFTLLAIVAGFHLMWPTIAVEGSDSFDAVQRAASYVFQRAWHVAAYSVSLLVYGAFAFLAVRGLALLLLKCTHAAVDSGMSVGGALRSSTSPTFTKLDSMWTMPTWQDLPLLPNVGDNNFWGRFDAVELSGTEWMAAGLISFWVFLVVALVGAFVVSFFFTGSTNMYLLLRRSVDGIDYDELYFEEFDDAALDPPPAPPAAAPANEGSKGTALPVMGGGNGPS